MQRCVFLGNRMGGGERAIKMRPPSEEALPRNRLEHSFDNLEPILGKSRLIEKINGVD